MAVGTREKYWSTCNLVYTFTLLAVQVKYHYTIPFGIYGNKNTVHTSIVQEHNIYHTSFLNTGIFLCYNWLLVQACVDI